MAKLILKGGKKVEDKLHAHHLGRHAQEDPEPPDPPDVTPPRIERESGTGHQPGGQVQPTAVSASVLAPVSPEELRKAWIKLEGYHPLTEQALGEVLQAFLKGRS